MADRTCSIDGCDRPASKRRWCEMHYWRWRQHGDPNVKVRTGVNKGRTCSADGCDNQAHARGLCGKHYQELRAIENGSRQCRRAKCTSLAVLDGLCKSHYNRRRRADAEKELRDARRCSVEGCDRPYDADGLCALHYHRRSRYGDVGPAGLMRGANGTGHLNKDGYRTFKRPDGSTVGEHILVMEQILKRRLVPPENVHHKNGIRDDNDPGNLELWLKAQPSGQRVSDLMEYIAEYHAELMAEMLEARGWHCQPA